MSAPQDNNVTSIRPIVDVPHQSMLAAFTQAIRTIERLAREVEGEPMSDESKHELMGQLLSVEARLVLANLFYAQTILLKGVSVDSLRHCGE